MHDEYSFQLELVDIARTLIRRGPGPGGTNHMLGTKHIYIHCIWHQGTMTKLLTQNANVNVLDSNGRIPLDIYISQTMDLDSYFRQPEESTSVLLASGG